MVICLRLASRGSGFKGYAHNLMLASSIEHVPPNESIWVQCILFVSTVCLIPNMPYIMNHFECDLVFASIWPPFLINDLIEQSNVNYWIYNTCILSQQFVWYPVRLFFELIQIYPHFGLHFDSIWPPFLRIDVKEQSNVTYISDNNSLMPQRFFWYPSRLCFELVETWNHLCLHLASFWPLNLGMI